MGGNIATADAALALAKAGADAVKVGIVGRLVPLEEAGVVDEVLH